MTKELTCVVCPAGCKITAELDENGKILSLDGYTCQRGKKYAESELTHPVRTLTSTIPVSTPDGIRLLAVRTNQPIPKETLFEAMKIIRKTKITSPVRTGDVIIPDFIEKGTSLIACRNVQ